MLFVSFPKGPVCLSYVFLITSELPTLDTSRWPTLPVYEIFVFRLDKYIPNSSITLKVGLDAIPLTYVFNTLS